MQVPESRIIIVEGIYAEFAPGATAGPEVAITGGIRFDLVKTYALHFVKTNNWISRKLDYLRSKWIIRSSPIRSIRLAPLLNTGGIRFVTSSNVRALFNNWRRYNYQRKIGSSGSDGYLNQSHSSIRALAPLPGPQEVAITGIHFDLVKLLVPLFVTDN
jgi:hypothetical protein